jgi:hypothetical protein
VAICQLGDERVLDVACEKAATGLAQVLRDRAQDDDLPPGQLRLQDEPR